MTLNKSDFEFIIENLNSPQDKEKENQYQRIINELKAIVRYSAND